MKKSRNKELVELFDSGVGIHHAGMLRCALAAVPLGNNRTSGFVQKFSGSLEACALSFKSEQLPYACHTAPVSTLYIEA